MRSTEKLPRSEPSPAQEPLESPSLDQLGEELQQLEVRRLLNNRRSAYQNLLRFAKRASWLGSMLAALHADASAYTQTSHPFVQESPSDLGGASKEIHRVLSKIGEVERLQLCKLDVEVIVEDLEHDPFSTQPIDAQFSHEEMALQVFVGEHYDAEKFRPAMEIMLAHEIGHFITMHNEDRSSSLEIEAFRNARKSNPEFDRKISRCERRIKEKEAKFSPDLPTKRKQIDALTARLLREDLSEEEARAIRFERNSLYFEISRMEDELTRTDVDYRSAAARLTTLYEEWEEKSIPFLLHNGGPEVIADFFSARWAVRQEWSAGKLNDAMTMLIGGDGPTSSPLYGPNIGHRRKVVQYFFQRIQENPEAYLHQSNEELIHGRWISDLAHEAVQNLDSAD